MRKPQLPPNDIPYSKRGNFVTYLNVMHTRLAERLAKSAPMVLPGVANPLAARVAEEAGFEAVYLTGAGVSNTNLGVPDIGLNTLTDVCDALFSVRDVIELPILVDADTGFGNAVNVYYAVRRLETAGASAIQLEDQLSPKRCGHFDGQAVISTEEMVAKIKAALDARRDEGMKIIARTDARGVEGFESALDRAAAYADAGADITFVEALANEDEMRRVPERLKVPQIVNIVHGGKTPQLPLERFEQLGFSIVLYANAALQASLAAMQNVLGEVARTGSLHDVAPLLASFTARQTVVRKSMFDDLQQRYAEIERTDT